ncbi:hypothetical protein [Azovibrio restrictus]|uniref:hypothetical protein n=1 Tax=Azovibrio restrictus TaxID=146938 RepID=UPI0012EBD880|nr:hypothetical protein [Azovibrio restrictus]
MRPENDNGERRWHNCMALQPCRAGLPTISKMSSTPSQTLFLIGHSGCSVVEERRQRPFLHGAFSICFTLGAYQSFMTIDQKGSLPMKAVSFIFVASVSILSGCAYNAAPYGASVANVESIKTLGIKPVSVAKFSSSQPGQSSITCRAAGPVSVSPSFETYIEKALIDELKLAGAYDASSTFILNGKLEEIDFSSGITDGKWLFTLTVSNARNQSFTTKSIFEFSGSFVADKACQETAQAFAPAVQKLVQDIVRNPQFRKIAN